MKKIRVGFGRTKRDFGDFSKSYLAFERDNAVLKARMLNLAVFTPALFTFAVLLSSIPYLYLGGLGAFSRGILRATLVVYSAMGIIFLFCFLLKTLSVKSCRAAVLRLCFPLIGKINQNIALFQLSGVVGMSVEDGTDVQGSLERAVSGLKDAYISSLYSINFDHKRRKSLIEKRDIKSKDAFNSIEEYFIFHKTVSPSKTDEMIAYNKDTNRKSFDSLISYFRHLKLIVFIAAIVFIFCRIAFIIYLYRLRFGM